MSNRERLSVGIDCGSTFCKGVLLKEGTLVAQKVRPTGWDLLETGRLILADLLAGQAEAANLLEDLPIVATGYGREKIARATKCLTEITCHGYGAEYLWPGVRTVIDIGGQDCKAINVEAGRVLSFQMNDKCAAGSGRFLEMILKRLDLDLSDLDHLLAQGRAASLNSTCVVFAESEIIGLLAQGCSRAEILGGVAQSMAVKIASLAARIDLCPPIILTGGLAASKGLAKCLSASLGFPVETVAGAHLAGAIGAAAIGLAK